jgi:hypothetical protein
VISYAIGTKLALIIWYSETLLKKEKSMMFGRKEKKLLNRLEDEIPSFLLNSSKKPSRTVMLGLGVASFLGSAMLDRVAKRSLWGPVIGVWGPLFLVAGLYSRMRKLEKEVDQSRSRNSLH